MVDRGSILYFPKEVHAPKFGAFVSVPTIQRSNGNVVISRRQISGMQAHLRYWDGPGVCICEPAPEKELETNQDRTLGGDNIEMHPADLPFELVVADFESNEARRALDGLSIVSSLMYHRTLHLGRWGWEAGVPVVYTTEYSLETRMQIARSESPGMLKLARRMVWEIDLERKQRAVLQRAAGIQCNGTPTFDAYRRLNPNTMLFFDGRTTQDMLVTADALGERHRHLAQGGSLRLGWSGRLNKMKGADHLPRIARAISDLGVPFTLDVFGGGVLAPSIQEELTQLGVADRVTLRGFVDFDTELTPHFQYRTDLWICPHVQGDPSGSYMEVLADGLPIIGYANQALAGLMRLVDAGRTVPVGDVPALARQVALVHQDRERLSRWSRNARAFASEHTFDKSFERRMQHLEAILRLDALRTAPAQKPADARPQPG